MDTCPHISHPPHVLYGEASRVDGGGFKRSGPMKKGLVNINSGSKKAPTHPELVSYYCSEVLQGGVTWGTYRKMTSGIRVLARRPREERLPRTSSKQDFEPTAQVNLRWALFNDGRYARLILEILKRLLQIRNGGPVQIELKTVGHVGINLRIRQALTNK